MVCQGGGSLNGPFTEFVCTLKNPSLIRCEGSIIILKLNRTGVLISVKTSSVIGFLPTDTNATSAPELEIKSETGKDSHDVVDCSPKIFQQPVQSPRLGAHFHC